MLLVLVLPGAEQRLAEHLLGVLPPSSDADATGQAPAQAPEFFQELLLSRGHVKGRRLQPTTIIEPQLAGERCQKVCTGTPSCGQLLLGFAHHPEVTVRRGLDVVGPVQLRGRGSLRLAGRERPDQVLAVRPLRPPQDGVPISSLPPAQACTGEAIQFFTTAQQPERSQRAKRMTAYQAREWDFAHRLLSCRCSCADRAPSAKRRRASR